MRQFEDHNNSGQKLEPYQQCPACEFSTDGSSKETPAVHALGNGKYKCSACGSVWKNIANVIPTTNFDRSAFPAPTKHQLQDAICLPKGGGAVRKVNSSFSQFANSSCLGNKTSLGLGAQVVLASVLTFCVGFGLLNIDRLSFNSQSKLATNSTAALDAIVVGSVQSRRGLKLSDVAINKAQTGASGVWIITGKVSNPGTKRLMVPALMMKNGGKPVQGWRYQPSRRMLGSAESFSFRIAMAAVPGALEDVSLYFDETR